MVVAPTAYVLDEDVLSRQFIRETMKLAGMRVQISPTADRFLEEFDPEAPGCIVSDFRMSQLSGLALLEYLGQQKVSTPVILLSSDMDIATAAQAMRAGAFDIVSKPVDPDHLLETVEQAIAHDARARRGRSRIATIQSCIEMLTPRELEVMELIVAGCSTKKTAHLLKASARTIEVHRGRVMKKMQVESIAELVLRAVACGHAPTIDEQEITSREPVIFVKTGISSLLKSA